MLDHHSSEANNTARSPSAQQDSPSKSASTGLSNTQKEAAIHALQQHFGDQLSLHEGTRAQHSHSMTWMAPQLPDAVLIAKQKHDIVDAVKLCAAHDFPIIAFGVGSSLEGHLNAPYGGLSIDTHQMDQVLQLNADDLTVRVQPGVARESLNTYLRDTGLFFPIDPGANASIGGMTATRASGTNAVRYGTMKDVVLGVEAVMPNGELINTAQRAKKSAAGYDLTRLLVGSEGTLGVFTEITLKLFGMPETIGSGVCTFESVEGACQAVMLTIQMGLPVARIELLDALQVKACNQYSHLQLAEKPTLFTEFHGTSAAVKEQTAIFAELIADFGGSDFQWSADPGERKKLWTARHNAYHACFTLRPGAKAYSTDACVPISRLADCVAETQTDIAAEGLLAPIVGHVGDGNFHVLLLIDTDNPEEVAKAERITSRLARRAIAMEGTCTGEHGVGQGKQVYLREELGSTVDVMQAIKQAIDPKNIMNPGKIF